MFCSMEVVKRYTSVAVAIVASRLLAITVDVAQGECDAVAIAADNLRADIERVCPGHLKDTRKIVVRTKAGGPWESSTRTYANGVWTVTGADRRGTIYGIYAISDELGVSPFHAEAGRTSHLLRGRRWRGNGQDKEGRIKPTWGAEWSPGLAYFNGCNMARRILPPKVVTIYRAALGDELCPPAGVAAFYNALPCEKSIKWVQGSTHGYVPQYKRHEFERKSKAK